MPEQYYVYQLRLETDDRPFYIGKGKGDRKNHHFYPSLVNKRSRKNHMIRAALASGVIVLTEILFDGLSEEQALAKEVELIALYGRRDSGTGILANHTDGGEGRSGHAHSDETRNAIRIARIGKKHTPETKAKMSASKKNMSQETKAKMSASRKGVLHTDEHKNGIKFSHWDRNPAWKIADSLYNSWLEHGRPGRTRMSEIHPGIRVDKIVRSFKEGWVPSKDELWNVYKLKKENRNDD
jgi:hypothetical protein